MDERPIMQQIADCYHALKPCNLIENDKMLASEILARKRQINTCLDRLFVYTGRAITADEAFEWEKNHAIQPTPKKP